MTLDADSSPDSPAEELLESSAPNTQQPVLVERSRLMTIVRALWSGIEVNLAFVVSPEVNKAIFDEYERRTRQMPIVKDRVKVMLELIETHFPDLDPSSAVGRQVRGYFFTRIGLWGRE